MKMVYPIYTKYFQNLSETHDFQNGADVGQSVNLLLCNPLYDVGRQQVLENSDYDFF